MRREDQIAAARKLLFYLDTRTTAMAEDVHRHPVADYTCPEQGRREQEAFFRRGPIMVGLSCLLPRPGDWMTHDHAGVPILFVRAPDGSLGAFLNVCRHRGARVAEGCGGGAATSFSCPYHAWTYGPDGALLSRPDDRSFAGAPKGEYGLRALPVAEKHGTIWVRPAPGPQIDVDAVLGGLVPDIAAYGLDTYHHYETRVLRRRLNWKLVVDTFLETYHLGSLHRATVDPIFYTNRTAFDAFGRNLRMIATRRTINELRQQPEDEWDVYRHTAIICVLFPNTVFIMQGDHIETWHVFPGPTPDESTMYVSLYIPEPAASDSARRHWDNNFKLLMDTVENEDFPTTEGMQRGFHSAAQETIVFGRNEPALQHYHKSIDAALRPLREAAE
ncbi:MAG: Rieske 2Fe-2S domain-containing protein [Alphaproteobacteria bacterium]|nr:Rieske 2Fe-2S domain-containing protein [Alphaproteobacteria bacterium]